MWCYWTKVISAQSLSCWKGSFNIMYQPSVSDFFKSNASGGKRSATAAADDDVAPEKKNRAELSPDQRKRMEENRAKALNRLADGKNARLMNLIGSSWKKLFNSEINQPYFTKVSHLRYIFWCRLECNTLFEWCMAKVCKTSWQTADTYSIKFCDKF